MLETDLPRSLAVLGALRRRRRLLRNMGGVLRLVAWASALLWLSFLLDWTLDLPWGIRAFHVLAATVLLVLGVRVLWFGPRRRLSIEQLAAQVEAAVGSLDQSLITAVQLGRAGHPLASTYSPWLLERTRQEAERRIEEVPVRQLLGRRTVLWALAASVTLLSPMVALAMLRGDLTRTYVARNLLLREVAWPREYLFEMIEPPAGEGETLLALGDPFTVQVNKLRGGNARVFLRVWQADGHEELLLLERRGESGYRNVFRNVMRDFRFAVEGGDYRGVEHAVMVRMRPRIAEISLRYEYPPYLGFTDGAMEVAAPGGHVKAPVGTTVHFEARTSQPIASAARLETPLGTDPESQREELLVGDDGSLLRGSFQALRNGYYEFALVSLDGFHNAQPIRYRIAVIPDHPPEVHFLRPGRNLEVSARARLPLELEARDDHGIASGALVLRGPAGADGQEELRFPLTGLVARGSEPGANAIGAATFELDVEALGRGGPNGFQQVLREGTRLEYLAEVRDAIDQVGSSRTYQLTIVRDEDLMRLIQDDLSSLRERLDETLGMQREARRELERIQDDALLSGGRVAPEEAQSVRQTRLTQEKIRQRLEESEERLIDIVDRVVQNQLREVQELPWIQGLRESVGELARTEGERALGALDELQERVAASDATHEQVQATADVLRSNERGLQDLVQKLREWGDLRTIVRKLEELLRTEQELEQKVREKVRGTLTE